MVTCAITGASKGLGLELCKQLAARGETVYALVRSGNSKLAELGSSVKVVEGIDVTKEDVADKLKAALEGVSIDVLICNAGAYGGFTGDGPIAMFASQQLDTISMDVMREAFEINTLGPLKVVRALLPQVPEASGSKILITTSLMGSIEDNTSGGSYAYRASKAAVNMVGKGLAMDLRDKGIAVGLIHPGIVATEFAGSDESKIPEGMRGMMHGVEPSVQGMIQAIDALTMSTTGSFTHANYGEGLKPCPW